MADLATAVRGYGEVRRRLSGAVARFQTEDVHPAIEGDRSAGVGFSRATEIVRAGRERLLADERGPDAVLPPTPTRPMTRSA